MAEENLTQHQENNKAEPQAGLDHVADQRSETLQVENTPEPHNGDLTVRLVEQAPRISG